MLAPLLHKGFKRPTVGQLVEMTSKYDMGGRLETTQLLRQAQGEIVYHLHIGNLATRPLRVLSVYTKLMKKDSVPSHRPACLTLNIAVIKECGDSIDLNNQITYIQMENKFIALLLAILGDDLIFRKGETTSTWHKWSRRRGLGTWIDKVPLSWWLNDISLPLLTLAT